MKATYFCLIVLAFWVGACNGPRNVPLSPPTPLKNATQPPFVLPPNWKSLSADDLIRLRPRVDAEAAANPRNPAVWAIRGRARQAYLDKASFIASAKPRQIFELLQLAGIGNVQQQNLLLHRLDARFFSQAGHQEIASLDGEDLDYACRVYNLLKKDNEVVRLIAAAFAAGPRWQTASAGTLASLMRDIPNSAKSAGALRQQLSQEVWTQYLSKPEYLSSGAIDQTLWPTAVAGKLLSSVTFSEVLDQLARRLERDPTYLGSLTPEQAMNYIDALEPFPPSSPLTHMRAALAQQAFAPFVKDNSYNPPPNTFWRLFITAAPKLSAPQAVVVLKEFGRRIQAVPLRLPLRNDADFHRAMQVVARVHPSPERGMVLTLLAERIWAPYLGDPNLIGRRSVESVLYDLSWTTGAYLPRDQLARILDQITGRMDRNPSYLSHLSLTNTSQLLNLTRGLPPLPQTTAMRATLATLAWGRFSSDPRTTPVTLCQLIIDSATALPPQQLAADMEQAGYLINVQPHFLLGQTPERIVAMMEDLGRLRATPQRSSLLAKFSQGAWLEYLGSPGYLSRGPAPQSLRLLAAAHSWLARQQLAQVLEQLNQRAQREPKLLAGISPDFASYLIGSLDECPPSLPRSEMQERLAQQAFVPFTTDPHYLPARDILQALFSTAAPHLPPQQIAASLDQLNRGLTADPRRLPVKTNRDMEDLVTSISRLPASANRKEVLTTLAEMIWWPYLNNPNQAASANVGSMLVELATRTGRFLPPADLSHVLAQVSQRADHDPNCFSTLTLHDASDLLRQLNTLPGSPELAAVRTKLAVQSWPHFAADSANGPAALCQWIVDSSPLLSRRQLDAELEQLNQRTGGTLSALTPDPMLAMMDKVQHLPASPPRHQLLETLTGGMWTQYLGNAAFLSRADPAQAMRLLLGAGRFLTPQQATQAIGQVGQRGRIDQTNWANLSPDSAMDLMDGLKQFPPSPQLAMMQTQLAVQAFSPFITNLNYRPDRNMLLRLFAVAAPKLPRQEMPAALERLNDGLSAKPSRFAVGSYADLRDLFAPVSHLPESPPRKQTMITIAGLAWAPYLQDSSKLAGRDIRSVLQDLAWSTGAYLPAGQMAQLLTGLTGQIEQNPKYVSGLTVRDSLDLLGLTKSLRQSRELTAMRNALAAQAWAHLVTDKANAPIALYGLLIESAPLLGPQVLGNELDQLSGRIDADPDFLSAETPDQIVSMMHSLTQLPVSSARKGVLTRFGQAVWTHQLNHPAYVSRAPVEEILRLVLTVNPYLTKQQTGQVLSQIDQRAQREQTFLSNLSPDQAISYLAPLDKLPGSSQLRTRLAEQAFSPFLASAAYTPGHGTLLALFSSAAPCLPPVQLSAALDQLNHQLNQNPTRLPIKTDADIHDLIGRISSLPAGSERAHVLTALAEMIWSPYLRDPNKMATANARSVLLELAWTTGRLLPNDQLAELLSQVSQQANRNPQYFSAFTFKETSDLLGQLGNLPSSPVRLGVQARLTAQTWPRFVTDRGNSPLALCQFLVDSASLLSPQQVTTECEQLNQRLADDAHAAYTQTPGQIVSMIDSLKHLKATPQREALLERISGAAWAQYLGNAAYLPQAPAPEAIRLLVAAGPSLPALQSSQAVAQIDQRAQKNPVYLLGMSPEYATFLIEQLNRFSPSPELSQVRVKLAEQAASPLLSSPAYKPTPYALLQVFTVAASLLTTDQSAAALQQLGHHLDADPHLLSSASAYQMIAMADALDWLPASPQRSSLAARYAQQAWSQYLSDPGYIARITPPTRIAQTASIIPRLPSDQAAAAFQRIADAINTDPDYVTHLSPEDVFTLSNIGLTNAPQSQALRNRIHGYIWQHWLSDDKFVSTSETGTLLQLMKLAAGSVSTSDTHAWMAKHFPELCQRKSLTPGDLRGLAALYTSLHMADSTVATSYAQAVLRLSADPSFDGDYWMFYWMAAPVDADPARSVLQSGLLDEQGHVRLPAAKIVAWAYERKDHSSQWRTILDQTLRRPDLPPDQKAGWLLARAYAQEIMTEPHGGPNSLLGLGFAQDGLRYAASEPMRLTCADYLFSRYLQAGQFDDARQFAEAERPSFILASSKACLDQLESSIAKAQADAAAQGQAIARNNERARLSGQIQFLQERLQAAQRAHRPAKEIAALQRLIDNSQKKLLGQ